MALKMNNNNIPNLTSLAIVTMHPKVVNMASNCGIETPNGDNNNKNHDSRLIVSMHLD
jgi:hypothetical protein